jgi:hypothetical protein
MMNEINPQTQIGTKNAKRDALVLWPAALAIGLPAAWAVIAGFPEVDIPGGFFLFPLLLLAWCGSTIAAAIVTIAALRRGHWCRGGSAALLPIIFLVAALNFVGFAQLCREAGDRFHFYVMRRSYLAQVAATPSLGHPRLLIWNWGGMIFSTKGVVYDESDEIALPPDKQSMEWKTNPGLGELACEGGYAFEPMGDHLYLAWFPC